MKLRIRCTTTKETIRVDVPDASSLFDLKTLIASKLSSAFSAPILPETVHLSLNRADEIMTSSPGESLTILGLTSGDLLFYSLESGFCSTSASPVETLAPLASTPAVIDFTDPLSESLSKSPADGLNVDVESAPFLPEKVPSVPCFLRRVMEAEKGKICGNMGLTIVAIHAVFLESGFVACSAGNGYSLPEGCAIASHLVSVMYSLPDLFRRGTLEDVKNVVLKFSSVGNHVSVYGCLVESHPDVYHLSLDSSKLAPLLSSTTNDVGGKEEDDVFQFWKTVKDRLSLPLLIEICQKNGLHLPPCFARLPTDLKLMILELLPGIDLAKVECACSELRYLASSDELWKRKFLEEFKAPDSRSTGGSWKEKFARFSLKRKKPKFTRSTALVPYGGNPRFMSARWIPGRQRFPMVGGDYDRLPAIGDHGSLRRTGFSRNLVALNFSPNCNLGGSCFP